MVGGLLLAAHVSSSAEDWGTRRNTWIRMLSYQKAQAISGYACRYEYIPDFIERTIMLRSINLQVYRYKYIPV